MRELHVALVLGLDGRIQRDGFVPENPEHLHARIVIPDAGADGALRARDAAHLSDRLAMVGNEVHDEQRERLIERCVLELQRLGVADLA